MTDEKETASLGEEIDARLSRLQLSFNAHGFDAYGVSRDTLASGLRVVGWMYRHYFSVRVTASSTCRPAAESSSSATTPVDTPSTPAWSSPHASSSWSPRGWPTAWRIASSIEYRSCRGSQAAPGQITGLPQHARQLPGGRAHVAGFSGGHARHLQAVLEPVLAGAVWHGFPAPGVEHPDAHRAVRLPGGGEAVPTIANLPFLGKLLGVPYVPLTPYSLPLPLPVRGEPALRARAAIYGYRRREPERKFSSTSR